MDPGLLHHQYFQHISKQNIFLLNHLLHIPVERGL